MTTDDYSAPDLSGHGPTAVMERLWPHLRALRLALEAGVRVALEIHRDRGWQANADLHLFHHLARREAMQQLVGLGVNPEDDLNLGLPMSGLILHPTVDDVVRVWYNEENKMRAPDSEVARRFVTQASSSPDLFDAVGIRGPGSRRSCRSFIQWATKDGSLTRFELVRPTGISRGFIEEDWKVDALSQPIDLIQSIDALDDGEP